MLQNKDINLNDKDAVCGCSMLCFHTLKFGVTTADKILAKYYQVKQIAKVVIKNKRVDYFSQDKVRFVLCGP